MARDVGREHRGGEIRTLERGDIYFFYRPRVNLEEAHGRADIQRFFVVLSPENSDRYRLAVIGAKQLPDPRRHGAERNWGYVEKVGDRPQPVREELDEQVYQTRTRGERRRPASRPAGEGVYRILRHGDHTHLVYALELPKEPGPVQEELNIRAEASYVLVVKNPEASSPPRAGLPDEEKAEYPEPVQQRFGGRAFIEADPPELLDSEGAEFILIGSADDLRAELGLSLDEAEEESASSADLFEDLKLDRSRRPTRPLLEGDWE